MTNLGAGAVGEGIRKLVTAHGAQGTPLQTQSALLFYRQLVRGKCSHGAKTAAAQKAAAWETISASWHGAEQPLRFGVEQAEAAVAAGQDADLHRG